ncbi:DUF3987 domain-containing protein [Microvirga massiliensis]|uniref:DUF3987 domain-containing protein n=1 Tax=Microvirga massiliensis TaxID=1033741 RepID=UPI0006611D92|nr:DUF3987 domain-containing protein [Microvirga massiliensis]
MKAHSTHGQIEELRAALLDNGYQPVAVYGPSKGGKKPFGNKWQNATGMPKWHPDAPNTGINSRGLRAIDIDVDEQDAEAIRALIVARLGPAPIRTRSNSGRSLLLYRAAEGEPGKRAVELDGKSPPAPGEKPRRVDKVEVLGRGQQFVAYGTHETGAPLEWLGVSPLDTPRSELRAVTENQIEALLAEIFERFATPAVKVAMEINEAPEAPDGLPEPRPAAAGGSNPDLDRRWAAARLKGEAKGVAEAPVGKRNDTLNTAALKLGKLVPIGLLTEAEIFQTLEAAAEQCGLTEDDGWPQARDTIRSGLAAGKKTPYDMREVEARRRNPDRQDRPHRKGKSPASGGSNPSSPQAPADRRSDRSTRLVPYDKLLLPTIRDRLDLETEDLPAAEFPIDALPTVMRGAVEAIEEHVQIPRALSGHCVLGASSLAAQAHRNVRIPALGRSVPLSLFLLALALSGERKTSGDSISLRAVAIREELLQVHYDAELKRYKAEKRAYDAEVRRIETHKDFDQATKADKLANLCEPRTPILPFLRYREPTFEGLQKQLEYGQPSVGLFSSEGGQFLGGHGMSDEARMRTITGLSVLWDSGETERVRAGEAVSLRGRRLSISLSVQPFVAGKLLKDELALRQGFVGRFLITMPESRIGMRIIRESGAGNDPRLLEFERAMRQLLQAPLLLQEGSQNVLDPPDLHFSGEAWELWRQAAQVLENGSGADGPWRPIQATALKMGENIARIAGILALLEDPEAVEISGGIMASAIAIGNFYLQEALRIVGQKQGLDDEADAVKKLAVWLTGVWKGELISPRIIQQRGPNDLRDSAEITRARVATLIAQGVLEPVGEDEIDGQNYRECYRIIRP